MASSNELGTTWSGFITIGLDLAITKGSSLNKLFRGVEQAPRSRLSKMLLVTLRKVPGVVRLTKFENEFETELIKLPGVLK